MREAADHGHDAIAGALAEAAREAGSGPPELRLVVEEVRPGRLRVREPGGADQADERHEDRCQADERLALEEADESEEGVAAEVGDGVDPAAIGEACRCAARRAR